MNEVLVPDICAPSVNIGQKNDLSVNIGQENDTRCLPSNIAEFYSE